MSNYACGVKTDDTVVCWGHNESGGATPSEGAFQSVSTGGAHTCGVRTGGRVVCWGSNEYGQAAPP